MQLELRRTSRSHSAYRAALWALVILGLATLYLQRDPWLIEATHEVSEGVEIAREAQADIILVIDYQAIRRSGPSFEQKDWSAAWINLLEQEVGPVTIATPQSLSQKVMSDARIVVLTSSVSDQVSGTLMERLREHVESGRLLVMERPSGALREAWSADGRAGMRRAQAVTFAAELAEPYATELRQMPLSTEYIGSTKALESGTTLLSMDGAPVIYARQVGQGYVITIDFDLGEQLVTMQQGRPGAGMRVRSAASSEGGVSSGPRTSDLVMDQRLIGSAIPYADLLERFVVYGAILRYAPAPTLWPYPDGAQGVVVALHEDSALGDGGGWMLDHEVSRKGLSSLVTSVDAGLTAAGAATLHRKGGDIGLLWKMEGTPEELHERVGIGAFRPAARPLTLKRQFQTLRETLPVNYVRTVRIAGGWWSERWSEPFAQMSQYGFRVDMSYEVPRVAGYAWGTGIPFLALGDDGVPLSVRELPVVIPDQAQEGASFLELLESSHKGHHMVMGLSHSPASFARYPDLARFNAWLEMFDAMERHGHVMTSAYSFDTFSRSRRASSLRSRLVEDAKLPSDSPSGEGVSNKSAQLMRVTVEAKARGLSLVVPALWNNQAFHSARHRSNRAGKEGSSARIEVSEVELVGFKLVRVPLERGFNTIDLYYYGK